MLSQKNIWERINFLEDVQVSKKVVLYSKMDKKRDNLHIFSLTMKPVAGVEINLNLIILDYIFQMQYYSQKTGSKPFWMKPLKSCYFWNCIENGSFQKGGHILSSDKKNNYDSSEQPEPTVLCELSRRF